MRMSHGSSVIQTGPHPLRMTTSNELPWEPEVEAGWEGDGTSREPRKLGPQQSLHVIGCNMEAMDLGQ